MDFEQNSTIMHFNLSSSATSPTTKSIHLAIPTNSIVIPVVMFALGVISNGLAIVTLLYFLWHGENKSSPTYETQPNASRDRQCSIHEMDTMGNSQRRESGFSRIRVRIRTRRAIKFGAFHTLVLTLAILDLMGSVCTAPLTIVLYTKNYNIMYLGGKPLCFYSAFAMMFFGFSTMAMVMTMSVERFLSIRHAYYYHTHADAKKAMVIALLILVAGALFCLMPIFGIGKIRPMYPYSWCFADWNAVLIKHKVFNYLYVALGAVMIIITITCNARVIQGLMKMKKSTTFNRTMHRRTLSCETQMIIQLLVITIIFIICWFPLLIRIMLNQLGVKKSPEGDRIAIWLVAANPILDPWVYILCRESVFQRVIQLVKKLPCLKSSKPETTVPVQSTMTRKQFLSPDYVAR